MSRRLDLNSSPGVGDRPVPCATTSCIIGGDIGLTTPETAYPTLEMLLGTAHHRVDNAAPENDRASTSAFVDTTLRMSSPLVLAPWPIRKVNLFNKMQHGFASSQVSGAG